MKSAHEIFSFMGNLEENGQLDDVRLRGAGVRVSSSQSITSIDIYLSLKAIPI